jgi:hypothetical protein
MWSSWCAARAAVTSSFPALYPDPEPSVTRTGNIPMASGHQKWDDVRAIFVA